MAHGGEAARQRGRLAARRMHAGRALRRNAWHCSSLPAGRLHRCRMHAGCMDAWMHGRVGAWACGRMAAELHGLTGAQVRQHDTLIEHGTSSTVASAQIEVDLIAQEWARHWDEGAAYECEFGTISKLPDALVVQSLRMAAASFPPETGLGGDNVSPRAYRRLSDEALAALALLLKACEQLGRWPRTISPVLVVLLPKPDGGRRPIVLFDTMVHLDESARCCGQGVGKRQYVARCLRRGGHGRPEGGVGIVLPCRMRLTRPSFLRSDAYRPCQSF